jgi:anti-sigma-K factor RskA
MNPHLKSVALAAIASLVAAVSILLVAGWITNFQLTEPAYRLVVALDLCGATATAYFVLRPGAGRHSLRRTSR